MSSPGSDGRSAAPDGGRGQGSSGGSEDVSGQRRRAGGRSPGAHRASKTDGLMAGFGRGRGKSDRDSRRQRDLDPDSEGWPDYAPDDRGAPVRPDPGAPVRPDPGAPVRPDPGEWGASADPRAGAGGDPRGYRDPGPRRGPAADPYQQGAPPTRPGRPGPYPSRQPPTRPNPQRWADPGQGSAEPVARGYSPGQPPTGPGRNMPARRGPAAPGELGPGPYPPGQPTDAGRYQSSRPPAADGYPTGQPSTKPRLSVLARRLLRRGKADSAGDPDAYPPSRRPADPRQGAKPYSPGQPPVRPGRDVLAGPGQRGEAPGPAPGPGGYPANTSGGPQWDPRSRGPGRDTWAERDQGRRPLGQWPQRGPQAGPPGPQAGFPGPQAGPPGSQAGAPYSGPPGPGPAPDAWAGPDVTRNGGYRRGAAPAHDAAQSANGYGPADFGRDAPWPGDARSYGAAGPTRPYRELEPGASQPAGPGGPGGPAGPGPAGPGGEPGDVASPSLVRSSSVMALGTLASRVTGLIRSVVLVYALGVTGLGNAYNYANTLPNTVYNLAIGGILTSVIVPLLVSAARRHKDRGEQYDQRMFTLVTVALAGITLVATLAADPIASLYDPHALPAEHHLLVIFAYFFIPQIFFYGVSSLAGAILNARGHFAAPMWTPVVNNVVVTVMALAFMGVAAGQDVNKASTVTNGEIILLGVGTTLGIIAQTAALI